MVKDFGIIYGDYDIIRGADLTTIEKATQLNLERGNKYLGVGVLDSELISDGAIKTTEARMKIILAFRGVDFVFRVTAEQLKDRKKMIEAAEQAYQEFLKTPEEPKNEVLTHENIYLPGTWDLLHRGHIENLEEASKMGKRLIVGVKSDELVKAHKNRKPFLPAEERMEIIRHLKCVDRVIQSHSRNPQIAIDMISSLYGIQIDAICVGSDLKADFESMRQSIDPQIDIVYTERPKNGPSTTKEMKKLQISRYTSLPSRMRKPIEGNPPILLEHDEEIEQ